MSLNRLALLTSSALWRLTSFLQLACSVSLATCLISSALLCCEGPSSCRRVQSAQSARVDCLCASLRGLSRFLERAHMYPGGSVHSLQKFCVFFSSCRTRRVDSCDIFPVHLCHVLLCHHCICVHFRRALESQAKRCLHISHHIGLHRLSTAHSHHIRSGAVQQHNAHACSKQ